jgi:hypothetical protein
MRHHELELYSARAGVRGHSQPPQRISMGAQIAHTAGTSRQSCLHVVGSHVVRTGSQRTGSQDVRQPRQLQLVRQRPP